MRFLIANVFNYGGDIGRTHAKSPVSFLPRKVLSLFADPRAMSVITAISLPYPLPGYPRLA
jgi:hypothetical protein